MRWQLVTLVAALVASASDDGVPAKRTLYGINIDIPPSGRSHRDGPVAKKFQNANTEKYIVNGSGIPDVDFDIGEAYAGQMSISSDSNGPDRFYFWFQPSLNPRADGEIVIWLNGGPGCSSLEGFVKESGPFLWQHGTYKPVPNPWAWHRLTNVLWVDQPINTGFSTGTVTARDEEDVARQFMGFFKNFIDTFSMQGYKVYLTGESYAGMYCPYIANAMLAAEDANYFNLKGMLIYDPVMVDDRITELNVVPFVDYHRSLFPLNDSFAKQIHDTDRKCGYADARRRYLKYPALGHLPDLLPGVDANSKEPRPRCDDLMLFELVIQAMSDINPCFNVYHVATTCPLLWDVLGFPGSFDYLPKGASIYFDRQDVKRAINAPLNRTWVSCGGPVFVREDNSPPSGSTVFGNVIDRTRNVVIAHGALDFILLANATLMAIQNMTFGGKLGFQKPPTEPFYVPYHTHGENSTLAGAGVFGTTHTERGLTYVGVSLSGHMVPQYAPSAAFRQLEFLLGRVRSLRSKKPFSIDPKFPQPHGPLGKGTAPPGYNHDKPGKRRDGKGSV